MAGGQGGKGGNGGQGGKGGKGSKGIEKEGVQKENRCRKEQEGLKRLKKGPKNKYKQVQPFSQHQKIYI